MNTKLLGCVAVGLSALTLAAVPAANEPWKRNAPITGDYDRNLAVTCHNGTFVGKQRGAIIEYLGIPYAIQPVGERRWQYPEAAPRNDGVFEAYDFGPRALQAKTLAPSRVPMGEDCLVLNVFRRADAPKGPLPVMVWIHGGAWITGSGGDRQYDPATFLADESGVILVTLNYRLGAMGFLPGLDKDLKYMYSANLGICDVACAIEWVKKNIAAFGGDDNNVTLFGESAGAGIVALVPFAIERASAHKFICQSGSITMTQPMSVGNETTRQFLSAAGVSDVKGLLKLSTDELLAAMGKVKYNSFPTCDGVTVPTDVLKMYPAAMRDRRLLIGTNERENNLLYMMNGGFSKATVSAYRDWTSFLAANAITGNDWQGVRRYFSGAVKPELSYDEKVMLFIGEMLFREGAIRQAEISSSAGIPTYVYYMTQPVAGHPDIGCCHGTDIAYVFNAPNGSYATSDVLYKERPTESRMEFSPDLSREMRKMWFNFAKTGDPSTTNNTWGLYNVKTHPTMILGPKTGMVDDPDGDVRQLLAPMMNYNRDTSASHGSLFDTWHVSE